jgi:mannosidase alpha-like ER degradation enhancer 2
MDPTLWAPIIARVYCVGVLPPRTVLALLVASWLVLGAAPQIEAPPMQRSAQQERALLASLVKADFKTAWMVYQTGASGHDELNPVSGTPHDWTTPTIFYMTPIDAFDTMWLMGLKDEAAETETLLLDRLSFDRDASVQVFEITIRVLGGLLTAYQLTSEPRFLALATDLGRRMLPAFDSPTGMPYRFVNLKTGQTTGAVSNPAEIGTLILEFGTLSKLTKEPVFYDKPKRALTALHARRSPTTGLVGESINVDTGVWTSPTSHIGGGIDSYYEYLIKCERLFGDADCGRMGREGLAAVNAHLADEGPTGLWYGEADMNTGRRTATIYGSLQAYLPAVFVLAGDVDRAARLQDSGFRMWTAYGVEPETYDYKTGQAVEKGYQLRPEIVESAYYLWHATHNPKYLEMGRRFLHDLNACCSTGAGYTVLDDVTTKKKGDRMPSFFLAETLKYLYLLFAPETTLDFDRVTFNTEAHPLMRTW